MLLNPFKIPPTPTPQFSALSEAILEVLSPESLRGCLHVLNQFKLFTFHGDFVFGEEAEIAVCEQDG